MPNLTNFQFNQRLMMRFCSFSLKSFIIKIFSLILFLGCASFVTHRGYECFLKYLEKPEAVDIAFKSSASQTTFFPAITFCSYYKPLKEHILKECSLTSEDYLKNNIWVGQGHENCTDPKVLSNQINYGLDDLKKDVDYFSILTYESSQLDSPKIYPNDSRFHWTYSIPNPDSSFTCHSMTLPQPMVELGINYFIIHSQLFQNFVISWHQDGLFYTDMPDSYPAMLVNGNGYYVPIGHQTLELLDYDGDKCEKSKDYKLDKCRYEYIEKVNTKYAYL